MALLEPTEKLKELEEAGRNFERLTMLEILKTKPFGAVWDYYCENNNVPVAEDSIYSVMEYENEVLGESVRSYFNLA